jgi:hypothetical protein
MHSERIETFSEFWPYYLGEHRRPICRALHYVGTSTALVTSLLAALLEQPVLLLPALVSGYFFAWIGHFFIEKNRPATFRYPLLSFRADLKLYALKVTGRLRHDPDFQRTCLS